MERRFYLVDAQVLPEVFLKVVRAKELLASGEARSISAATRAVDLSRSAFYKYKDCIFDSENGREVITVMATLRDETGALQSLLAGISAAGASIVTINQSTPENGAALVAVTIRTDTMQMTPEELTEKLSRQRMVVGRALRIQSVSSTSSKKRDEQQWLKLQFWALARWAAACTRYCAATLRASPAVQASRWRSSTSLTRRIFRTIRTHTCL